MNNLTQGHFRTKLIQFFFSKEFSVCYFELCICYLQVLMQKRRYLIQVKILDQSDPGAFSYRIDTSFFFSLLSNEIFICFLDPLMLYPQVFMNTRRHSTQVKILD